MTRLSEALKRASEASAAPATLAEDPPLQDSSWQFAPVETMHVPEEPPAYTPDVTNAAAPPLVDSVLPDAMPDTPVPSVPFPPAALAGPKAPRGLQFTASDRDKLVISPGVDHALIEQYRHLAAVLHHAQKSSGVRTVMITSAIASEGKTLTATNLALTLSESYQKRVLLIDADLRRPRMQEMFGLPMGEGLIDALTAERANRLPVHQMTPHLWLLPSGRILSDPMSLLVSPAMKQLIEDARESFDWVIVDTPPIAILPDANLLSAMIDTALLVVSAQSTPYPLVQRAADAIGANRILGVVLNRAERVGLSPGYGYYGYKDRKVEPKGSRWFGWLRRKRQ